jgi:hypothetical protein
VDTDIDAATLEQLVVDSGLWAGGRRETHGFLLSPDVYRLTDSQHRELVELGPALESALVAFGRMAAFAADPRNYHSRTWGKLKRIFRTGIPDLYREIQLLGPDRIPRVLKVDLMETADGTYQIAEIDGHNKHGLGYSTLGARLRQMVAPGEPALAGAARMIADELSAAGESELLLLYGDQERFYLPEFRVFAAEMAGLGIDVVVASELDCSVASGQVLIGNRVAPRRWVDFPYLNQYAELGPQTAELYQNGEIEFLIPPKPFLGSKALLAILRNDEQDDELEGILREYIPENHLHILRRMIPETYVLRRKPNPIDSAALLAERSFILKESVSSGMKGTVFEDDPQFAEKLAQAGASYYRFILQAQVENRGREFQYFPGQNGTVESAEWFSRVTVHYALPEVADVIVTARQDKAVHGAPDCLQLGTVIPDSP